MIDNFIRDLHLLWKADSLIGKIWLTVTARRFGLYAFAGLIAVFGLGMINVAGFYAMQAWSGPVGAASLIALGDFVLAVIVMVIGRSAAPGPDLDLAFEVRKMAIEALQADAREVKANIDALAQDIQDTKNRIAGIVHNPLDAATQKILIPAALSMIRGLRAKAGDK